MSVRAALSVLANGSGLREMLRASIAYTGDVDTVATIALGAASRSTQLTADLPAVLVDELEQGPYGRDYLNNLDNRLLAWAGARATRS
ncbi:hypothetical protein SAMN05216266_109165 [Amycolatopsis marina]|uniref:ADP-ribosylglycohydrolase n=1 Tax=Amycolatopsis marina TaxID=490629 RepID=A0A1I1ALV9_9PSEU|nr:hypothetical protein [Amycolatopsis marina]SFB37468.1 hypothetical protein SAMN05216266_109165 [Amycolatopsis marina]